MNLSELYERMREAGPGGIVEVPSGSPIAHGVYPHREPKQPLNSLYLIGSMRNPQVPELAKELRAACPGLDVFDDWCAVGPEADDYWMAYEKAKGVSYIEALQGHTARQVFEFDRKHINRCDAVALIMPAGKSAHMELGYASGKGKRTAVVFDQEPERWDIMYGFADKVFTGTGAFIEWIKECRAA